jgi:hypothetical protein
MDLNIDHYSLEDLLKLFKLPQQFTEADLKEARKRVVAVHPDKSGLDKEYFLFFHKAYSLLSSVYSFKRKAEANMYETPSFADIMETMEETDKRLLAERFSNNPSFSKEFNALFESLYMREEDGYGDWLQSNEDLDQSFEERKKQSRAMVVSTIDAANTPYYSDLKSVYTVDTVIGVSEADYRKGFATVEELKQNRSKQIAPLQREQAEQLLSRQEEEESRLATERAFRLLQEEKVNQQKQQSFWSKLMRLQ